MTEPMTLDHTRPTDDDLPRTVLGVEQEYKWRIDATEQFGVSTPSLVDLEHMMPAPAESRKELSFRHTQSTIYFDDKWRLATAHIALRATVNPGTAKNVSWLGVKQTIAWVDGCRDSLEVNERVAPADIGSSVRSGTALPMTYLRRMMGEPLPLTPYGSVVQHRHKIFYRNHEGMLLQLTFDIAESRVLPAGEPVTSHWLEIENNTSDLRARRALNRWAAAVSGRLGCEPVSHAKSEVVARMAGWRSRIA